MCFSRSPNTSKCFLASVQLHSKIIDGQWRTLRNLQPCWSARHGTVNPVLHEVASGRPKAAGPKHGNVPNSAERPSSNAHLLRKEVTKLSTTEIQPLCVLERIWLQRLSAGQPVRRWSWVRSPLSLKPPAKCLPSTPHSLCALKQNQKLCLENAK